MSEVKVNKVTPRSGTTLTIGDSGDTTNVVGTLQNNGAALVGDISSVVAGTNLSGGGTSGAVTINLADASTSAKGASSFSSDNFAASSGAITIKDLGVATAEIQDDAVTLGKMAPGTDGNIISYDASGNPVAVATGSAGQVLTSAGAGAPPTFAAAAAAGLNKIATVTEGSGHDYINIDGCFTSTYNNYLIVGKANVTFGNTNIGIRVRASGTPLTSNSYSRNIAAMFENTYSDSANQTYISMSYNYLITNDVNWFFYVYSPKIADQTYVSGMMTTANLHSTSFSGLVNNTTAYDGIQIFNANTGSGDLNSSKTTVYGLAL